MIRQLPESKGATIGVELSGKIENEEANNWIEICDKLIEEYGRINILVLLDEKINYGVHAVYDDLRWTFKNMKHINRIAIISESKTLEWLVKADSPFASLIGISERHFETSDLQNAWNWIKE